MTNLNIWFSIFIPLIGVLIAAKFYNQYTGSFNFAKTERLYNLITFKEFVDLFNKSKNKIYECW
jgi:hypothetical protein